MDRDPRVLGTPQHQFKRENDGGDDANRIACHATPTVTFREAKQSSQLNMVLSSEHSMRETRGPIMRPLRGNVLIKEGFR